MLPSELRQLASASRLRGLSVLGVVNVAVALVIVLLFAVTGGHWVTGDVRHWDPGGAILGLILGIVVAVVVCGLLAIAISIEKSVRIIADSMVSGSVRIEPRVR
jgi:TRAP-type C4-dicarboxylate transport system permease small subunit